MINQAPVWEPDYYFFAVGASLFQLLDHILCHHLGFFPI